MRVLVVDDDARMASVLQRALRGAGYAVDVAADGDDALWGAIELAYDVVVLDATIPEPDGFEVCRRLRARESWVPVIMVTGRDEVADRVRGLDAGADDYLVKPFHIAELLARVRALVRREPVARPPVLRAGDLGLDPASRVVVRGGTCIDLSAKEFALLELLLRRAGDVVSRTTIREHVWDVAYDGDSNVVDVYVRYLRDKVDRPFGRHAIETVRGAGYRLKADGG